MDLSLFLFLCIGFLFPNIPQQDLDAMTFSFSEQDQATMPEDKDSMASLEMERMTAKLELLFIRGTPTDLHAANELIKVMASKRDSSTREKDKGGEEAPLPSAIIKKAPSSSELLAELFGPVVTDDDDDDDGNNHLYDHDQEEGIILNEQEKEEKEQSQPLLTKTRQEKRLFGAEPIFYGMR